MRRSTVARAAGTAGAVAVLATGCLSSGGNSDNNSNSGSGGSAKKTVSIMFGFTGDQAKAFEAALNPYLKSIGVTPDYISSDNFNQLIATKVSGGNTPDIAAFPQPGLLQQYAKQGKLQDISKVDDMSTLKSSLVNGYLQSATVDGKVYGAPISGNVKSLVFYDKAAWKAAGYTVPKTQAQLFALTDQIRKSGKTPWCLGIESGSATGWPATDWVEDLMLQDYGPTVYAKWVNHTIKFDSPQVKHAMEQFQSIFATDGNVFGGRKAIASNAFQTALNPLFTSPPGCYMGKQGNFITQSGFFPAKVFKNLDSTVGVFQFPGAKAGTNYVEGGGDLAAEFTKGDKNVDKIYKKITQDPTFGAPMAQGGFEISPHKDFPLSNYPNNTVRAIAKIAYSSKELAFDGSDSMPAAVGTGTFWKGMTAWISGSQSLDQTASQIDASWPSS